MNIYEVKTEDGSGWVMCAENVIGAALVSQDNWMRNGSPIASITLIGKNGERI